MSCRLVGLVNGVLVALLAAAPVSAVVAQTSVVRGIVVDAATHARIPFARVTVAGTTLFATTANDGSYVISGIPVGEQTLDVSRAGFGPASSGCRRIAASDTARVAIPIAAIGSDTSGDAFSSAPAVAIGEVAGLTVWSRAGSPGSPHFISMRGLDTLNDQPAYVIDEMVFPAGHAPRRALSLISDRVEQIDVDSTPAAIARSGVCSATSVITVRVRPPNP